MQKILIVGSGLIGFSFARALKEVYAGLNISVFDNDDKTLDDALLSGIANEKYNFTSEEDFDLVVVSTPLLSYEDIFAKIDLAITTPLIIDLGSLNSYPLSLKKDIISCHPIAGSEKFGILNSDKDLFRGKDFVISYENEDLWLKNENFLTDMVKKIGSNIRVMDADEHDRVYALVSHLPQFLSFLTSDMLPNFHDSETLRRAFRLNSSQPSIWGDIFDINSNNIEQYYSEFFENLCGLIEDIDNKNCVKIAKKLLKNTNLCHNCDIKDEKFADFDFSKADISKILFRLIIVLSYVRIKDLKQDFSFAGSGFKDFIVIIKLFDNIDEKFLSDLLERHRKSIIESFDKISI